MTTTEHDAVDTILGTPPGSALDELRRLRPVTRDNTEASYRALFHADELGDANLTERFAVAVFVAALHGNVLATAFYGGGLRGTGAGTRFQAAVTEAAASGATFGPYGDYREIGLRDESRPGLQWTSPPAVRDVLGPRLGAALEHAHLLVFRPRESSPAALDALLTAGWTTTGIVTLSQLVAFLAYQLRVVSGLQLLATTLPAAPATTEFTADTQTVRIGS